MTGDTALRYRHRFDPWREQLTAAIVLLREAEQRDRSVLARASHVAALAQAQEVVSGASDVASVREAIARLRDQVLRTVPPSKELAIAAAARARALDAVLAGVDAMPLSTVCSGHDPAPASAA